MPTGCAVDIGGLAIAFVDGSAHSFIKSLRIRSSGEELEYIGNYDVLGSYFDMVYSDE